MAPSLDQRRPDRFACRNRPQRADLSLGLDRAREISALVLLVDPGTGTAGPDLDREALEECSCSNSPSFGAATIPSTQHKLDGLEGPYRYQV